MSHIFEGRITGPVCYCVPNAIGACATCRAERQERAAFDVVKESDRIADAAALAPPPDHKVDAFVYGASPAGPLAPRRSVIEELFTSTPKPLVSDWIERFMKARDKAIAESFVTTKKQVVRVNPDLRPGGATAGFAGIREWMASPDYEAFQERLRQMAADARQELMDGAFKDAPVASDLQWSQAVYEAQRRAVEHAIDPPVITSRPEHRSYDEYRQVYGGVEAKEMLAKPERKRWAGAGDHSPGFPCDFMDCLGVYTLAQHGGTECSKCGDRPEEKRPAPIIYTERKLMPGVEVRAGGLCRFVDCDGSYTVAECDASCPGRGDCAYCADDILVCAACGDEPE